MFASVAARVLQLSGGRYVLIPTIHSKYGLLKAEHLEACTSVAFSFYHRSSATPVSTLIFTWLYFKLYYFNRICEVVGYILRLNLITSAQAGFPRNHTFEKKGIRCTVEKSRKLYYYPGRSSRPSTILRHHRRQLAQLNPTGKS